MRSPLLCLIAASALAACAGPSNPSPDVADASAADASADTTPMDVTLADVTPESAPDVLAEDARPEDVADVRAPESNCANGADDDLDGDSDCADPDCEPVVRCITAPEAGWSAPGVLNTGTTAAACAAPFDTQAYLGNADPMAAPPTCSPCTCGAPTELACVSSYVCERTSGCAGTCNARSVEGSGCVDAPGPVGTYAGRSGPRATGRCGAGTSTPTRPSPTWGRAARLCTAASATGCASGQVCVPRAASAAPVCVVRAGDVACPAVYTVKQVFYGDFNDTRACTACVCSLTATGCSVSFTAYSQPSCAGTATPMTTDTCYTGDPASYRITHTVADAACAFAFGGAPTGTVTATTPSTVCCAP